MKNSLYLSLFFSLIFCVNSAFANDGPSPQIWLEQIGSDVKVTYQLHEDGEPGVNDLLALKRDDSNTNSVILIEDTSKIGTSNAVENGIMCRVDDSIEEPVADCDNDSTPDCAGWCSQWYKFNYLDKSIPVGTYTYYLQDNSIKYAETDINVTTESDGGLEDAGMEDTVLVDAEQEDAADADADSDTDTDTDSDTDTDTDTDTDSDSDTDTDSDGDSDDDGGDGCSISLSPNNIGIGSVMLMIGIVSLLISSRRKR